MTNPTQPESDLVAEIRQLGQSLSNLLRAAWASPERQKLKQEIESGLAEVSASLKQAAADLQQSETGQRVRADLEDLRTRMERGEVEARLRVDLLQALRTINAELERATGQWASRTSGESGQAEESTPRMDDDRSS